MVARVMAEDIPQTFTHVLVHDVLFAEQRLRKEDTPTHRRELVRAAVAAIEGLHWRLKQDVAKHAAINLSFHERAAMAEETYAVDERGHVNTVPRFMPLATAIRLVVRIVQRYRTQYKVDFDHQGWTNLKNAIVVRNRIVHPKSLADLTISDEEIGQSISGFAWLLALVIEVLRETQEHLLELTAIERVKSGSVEHTPN
jgi:hypothetical protein